MVKNSTPKRTQKIVNGEAVVSGEAVNNVAVKDMSPKIDNMDMQKFAEMQKKFDELMNANTIILSSKIRNKEVRKGNEIVNKQTGIPEVDEHGQPKRYADTFTVTLLFQGGSLEYKCKEEMYEELELNSTYQFKGYMGAVKEFGKDVISPIFQSYTKVM